MPYTAELYYKIIGKGSPVLLLHGFLEDLRMWNFLYEEWKEKHTMIAIDLTGHGKSVDYEGSYLFEKTSEQIMYLLKQEKVNSVTIVGHSMGGYVTLALAEKYPKAVEKLILLNSTSEADSQERKANRSRAVELVKKNKKAFLSMSISNLFADENRARFHSEIETLKKMAYKIPAEKITESIIAMKIRKDRTSVLKKWSAPKFIIAGKNDSVIPFESIKAVSTATDTPLITLNGGHMSSIENRSELLSILNHIL